MLSPHSVLFLFSQMHHDEMGVRSDSLYYAKRRPSFLLKLILVRMSFRCRIKDHCLLNVSEIIFNCNNLSVISRTVNGSNPA